MSRLFWLGAALGMAMGCDAGEPPRGPGAVRREPAPAPGWEVSERLPKGWDTGDLARAALREWRELRRDKVVRGVVVGRSAVAEWVPSPLDGKHDKAEARILMWGAWEAEDGRSRYDICLLWLRVDVGGGRWALAHLRRTRASPTDPEWTLFRHFHSAQVPRREFDAPPTNGEVYQFLQDSEWSLTWPRFRVADAVVRAGAWQEATGQRPTIPFPRLPPPARRASPNESWAEDAANRFGD
jgi:hypothetical protein